LFHLGAQLLDPTGLPPGQFEEIVAGGWVAIHDGCPTGPRQGVRTDFALEVLML
jgi:hypothetical protein